MSSLSLLVPLKRLAPWWFAASVAFSGCWGAPVEQSAACAAWLGCLQAMDKVDGETTNVVRYVEGGYCWRNPELARGCTTSCERALLRLRERPVSLLSECQP